jgi:hypothetical protein
MSDNDLSQQQKIDAFSRDLALFLARITGRESVQKIHNLPKVIAPPVQGKSTNQFTQRKRNEKHEQ